MIGPGADVLADLRDGAGGGVLHAGAGRALHRVLLPRGHHPPLRRGAAGQVGPRVACHASHSTDRDSLGPAKIAGGLLLLGGVVLVCRPPFLFHHQSLIQVASFQTCKQYITRPQSQFLSYIAYNAYMSCYNILARGPQDPAYPLYCVGLALAGTSCVSGGVMNVTVSRCSHVPRY